jgi:hypothetical protein
MTIVNVIGAWIVGSLLLGRFLGGLLTRLGHEEGSMTNTTEVSVVTRFEPARPSWRESSRARRPCLEFLHLEAPKARSIPARVGGLGFGTSYLLEAPKGRAN